MFLCPKKFGERAKQWVIVFKITVCCFSSDAKAFKALGQKGRLTTDNLVLTLRYIAVKTQLS